MDQDGIGDIRPACGELLKGAMQPVVRSTGRLLALFRGFFAATGTPLVLAEGPLYHAMVVFAMIARVGNPNPGTTSPWWSSVPDRWRDSWVGR